MASGNFKRINRIIAREWVEKAAKDALRSLLDKVPMQQLYITEGVIAKAILLQRAVDSSGLRGEELDISTIKREADNLSPVRKSNAQTHAKLIFKQLKSLIRHKYKDKASIIVTSKSITIVGTFTEISNIKSKLTMDAASLPALQEYLEQTQIGHVIGVTAIAAASIQSIANELNIPIPPDIQDNIEFIFDMEFDSELDVHIRRYGNKLASFNLTLEYDINMQRGSAVGQASKNIKEWFRREIDSKLRTQKVPSHVFNKLLSTKLSNSIEDEIGLIIENAFLEKKLRSRRKLRRAALDKKAKSKKKLQATTLAIKGVKGRRKGGTAPSLFRNLLDLKNIINANMHEILKTQVMGQGGDSEILNYKTGRFARSAKLLNLTPMSAGLQAQITWQRYPYDTFAPGGKLHKPMRDPNYLIGKSIREIMKDLGLAQLNITTKAE